MAASPVKHSEHLILVEAFKPIPVPQIADRPALFWARCCIDLQLLTIFQFLRQPLQSVRGSLVDVGAGQGPWRSLLHPSVKYVAVDVAIASEFGMGQQDGTLYYDGVKLPLEDESLDAILCTEVIEHVPDVASFLQDLNRVLRKGGTLILTVPWAARVHHQPHEYARFSRFGLERLLSKAAFHQIEITERGNDVTAIANKLIVLCVRLLRPKDLRSIVFSWPTALILLPLSFVFLMFAHLTLTFGWGSRDDPLGYGVIARKPLADNP